MAADRDAAAWRAARTGALAAAGFSLGRWSLHDTDVAVFATFFCIAVTGIADFGGGLRGRCQATLATGVVGAALTALGTWVSTRPVPTQVVVMAVVTGLLVAAAAAGGYAVAGSVAVTLCYLVAAGSPAATSHLPGRLTGMGLGTGLALFGACSPLGHRADDRLHGVLADGLDDLADRLEGRPAAQQDLRPVVDALEGRPSAPTAASRAALYLLNDLERLESLVVAASTVDPERRAAVGERLRGAATVLRNGRGGPTQPAPTLGGFDVADRLKAVAGRAAVDARGAVVGSGHPDGVVRRLAGSLTPQSVAARDAARTAAALAAATAVAGAWHLAHGFWVAFATLTVVRSSLRVTTRRVGAALIGTTAGAVGGLAAVAAVGGHTGVYAALLPVVVAGAIYANVRVGFAAGQAVFTVAIVVLFNLLSPAGWHIGIVRVEDVATGALTGAIVGALAWPRGAVSEVRADVGRLTSTGAAYLAAVVRALVDPTAGTRLARARQDALAASVRADATLAQLLAEAPPASTAMRAAADISAAQRLWYAADLLRSATVPPSSPAAALLAVADRLEARSPSPGAPPDDPLLAWLGELATAASTSLQDHGASRWPTAPG